MYIYIYVYIYIYIYALPPALSWIHCFVARLASGCTYETECRETFHISYRGEPLGEPLKSCKILKNGIPKSYSLIQILEKLTLFLNFFSLHPKERDP